MSTRELRALGINTNNLNTNTNTTAVTTNQVENTTPTTMATTALQVNPFHHVIDLTTADGKKLYQKATQGLPEEHQYKGDSRDIIPFIERIQSKSEEFGWEDITTEVGPENVDLFKTPGKLTVSEYKAHCDPKWSDGSNGDNVQFCIKSNMFYLFVKNSCSQCVLDDLKEEEHHWKRPGGGDGGTLLIAIYSQNVHGTRASAVVAKSELLSMRSKHHQHNIQDVNKAFLLKEKEIAFGGESNPDVLFQLFQIYESGIEIFLIVK